MLLAVVAVATAAGCGASNEEHQQSAAAPLNERERRAERERMIERAVRRYNLNPVPGASRAHARALLRAMAPRGPYHAWCGLTVTDEQSGRVGVQAFHPTTKVWIEAEIDPESGILPGSVVRREAYIPGGYEPDQWFSMLTRQCAIDRRGLLTLI
jgi:hypothetical protein